MPRQCLDNGLYLYIQYIKYEFFLNTDNTKYVIPTLVLIGEFKSWQRKCKKNHEWQAKQQRVEYLK